MIKKQESNFKKAINELLGYSSEPEDSGTADYTEEPQAVTRELPGSEEVAAPEPAPTPTPVLRPAPSPIPYTNPVRMTAETSKVSAYTVETKTLSMEPMSQVSSKVSVVTEDMIVSGDIATQSDLNIFGQVTGSVVCRGDVLVMGRVTGDVSGVNVRIEGEIIGNLTADKRVDMGANGRIKGDIMASSVSSEGISEGDIKAEETIYLGGNSVVTGKIYAKSFAIIQGAKIKGMMTTYD